ncbi:hypothetical protein ACHAWF_018548 [Thalassiosira exigua]
MELIITAGAIRLWLLVLSLAAVPVVVHASGSELKPPPPGFWGLESKTALVTGGTKGIGAAIVTQLSSLGCRVLTCSRNGDELADRLFEWNDQHGFGVQGVVADVSTPEGRETLRQQVEEKFGGKLDVLVNNVGSNIRKKTVDYTEADYELYVGVAFKKLRLHPSLFEV